MNVFVAFTPYQLFVIKTIVDQYDWVKKDENICLNFCGNIVGIEFENMELVNLESGSLIKKINSLYKYKKLVKNWMAVKKKFNLFISHPFQAIANNLIFSNMVKKKYLFEEGLLNYCDFQINQNLKRKMKAYSLFGFLARMKYTCYEGSLTAIETLDYDGIFSFDTLNLVTIPKNKNIYKLELKENNRKHKTKSILILDQPLLEVVSISKEVIMWELLVGYINNLNITEIYYKKHQRGKDNYLRLLSIFPDCKSIDCEEPIELIIDDYAFSHVASFFSSALANVKLLNPSVVCCAIGLNHLSQKEVPAIEAVVKFFKTRGVVVD